MEVLELVHGLEFDNIKTIWQDTIGLAFQEMFGFIRSDVRNGGEYICAVCRGAFDAISVVDTTLSGFVIDVKVLKVVIKVNRAGTQVSAQKGRVCCEDRGNIDVPLPTERNGDPSLPFVEMCHDSGTDLPGKILATREEKS